MVIAPFARIAVLGNSITAGTNGPPWYPPFAALARAYYTRTTAPTYSYGTTSAPATVTSYDCGAPSWAILGVAGETLNEFAARLSLVYSSFGGRGPTNVIMEGSINDVTSLHPDAQCQTELTTLVTGLLANCRDLTAAKIMLMLAWINGEKTTAGVFTGNGGGFDSAIYAKNTALTTTCTSLGIQALDTRTPTGVLETTLNPSNLADGILTVGSDGKHPNAAGATQLSAFVYAACTFTG